MDEIRAEILAEINALKQLLSATDYQAIKHSEGEISDEEYASIRDKRRAWRSRINELEALEQSAPTGTEEPETEEPGRRNRKRRNRKRRNRKRRNRKRRNRKRRNR